MPASCEKCNALERWLHDLRLEIAREIDRRERGFSSPHDEQVSRRRLDEVGELLAKTEALYERHQREHARGAPA